MKTNQICRVCKVELNDDNWYSSFQKDNNYICKECQIEKNRLYRKNNPEKVKEQTRLYREENSDKIKESHHLYIGKNRDEINARQRLYRKENPEKAKASSIKAHRKNGALPMNENKECSSYFGVHINERLLRHKFNDVEVMPYGHTGYDFICNHGKKIDSKSSCIRKNRTGWSFTIKHNTTADYFLLVAYDNREDLNPMYIWLIPGHVLNHLVTASISPSTIHKWDEYKQNIDEVRLCCDEIRSAHKFLK